MLPLPGLRQAVVVAADLDATAGRLQRAFGLGAPYADPGVAAFGLRNAVFAVGDAFLEVVAPVAEGTAAGRHLDRLGDDGGYMAIFQVPDLADARARAASLGVRAVWSIDLPDIAATHLHPADTGGAILSLNQAEPPASWRWGGPDRRPGPHALGTLTVEVPDPEAARARWAALLGVDQVPSTTFVRGDRGIVGVAVTTPDGAAATVEVGACRVGAT